MTHPRKAVRDAVVALLTGTTAAGSRVYASSAWPQSASVLPAIVVWTPGDSRYTEGASAGDGHTDLGAPAIDRSVDVRIEARVAQASGSDDALDALCREIEQEMAGNLDLGGTALFQLYDQTEVSPTDEQGIPGQMAALEYRAVTEDDWS